MNSLNEEFYQAMWSPELAQRYNYLKNDLLPLREQYIRVCDAARRFAFLFPTYTMDEQVYEMRYRVTKTQIQMMHGQVSMIADWMSRRFTQLCEAVFRGDPIPHDAGF